MKLMVKMSQRKSLSIWHLFLNEFFLNSKTLIKFWGCIENMDGQVYILKMGKMKMCELFNFKFENHIKF